MSDLIPAIMEQSTFRARRILELQEENKVLKDTLEDVSNILDTFIRYESGLGLEACKVIRDKTQETLKKVNND